VRVLTALFRLTFLCGKAWRAPMVSADICWMKGRDVLTPTPRRARDDRGRTGGLFANARLRQSSVSLRTVLCAQYGGSTRVQFGFLLHNLPYAVTDVVFWAHLPGMTSNFPLGEPVFSSAMIAGTASVRGTVRPILAVSLPRRAASTRPAIPSGVAVPNTV
jgi:hypothetical protein